MDSIKSIQFLGYLLSVAIEELANYKSIMQDYYTEEFIEDNLQDFDNLSESEKQLYFEKALELSEKINNE